jgi:hypothetical protein
MIPSDADAATLFAAIYAYAGAPVVDWDHLDTGDDDGVCWALKRFPGYDAIVLRGSITLQDWFRDLRALPIITRIGTVHDGFHAGMEHAWWASVQLWIERFLPQI